MLEWNASLGAAECRLDEAFCGTSCRTKIRPGDCVAKNLCDGVVCL